MKLLDMLVVQLVVANALFIVQMLVGQQVLVSSCIGWLLTFASYCAALRILHRGRNDPRHRGVLYRRYDSARVRFVACALMACGSCVVLWNVTDVSTVSMHRLDPDSIALVSAAVLVLCLGWSSAVTMMKIVDDYAL